MLKKISKSAKKTTSKKHYCGDWLMYANPSEEDINETFNFLLSNPHGAGLQETLEREFALKKLNLY